MPAIAIARVSARSASLRDGCGAAAADRGLTCDFVAFFVPFFAARLAAFFAPRTGIRVPPAGPFPPCLGREPPCLRWTFPLLGDERRGFFTCNQFSKAPRGR